MKRYDALNAENPGDPYFDADLIGGTEGSFPSALGFDATMTEIEAAITALGGVASNDTWSQLGTQLVDYIAAQIAASAGGKVAKAGDGMTGALSIVLAALQLTLRHSDNTASLKDHLRLFRGTGAGSRASIQTLGDAANGLTEIDFNFLSSADALVKAIKFKSSGRIEAGADPVLPLEVATMQFVQSLLPAAATNPETLALAVSGKYLSPSNLAALIASTTQLGLSQHATAALARSHAGSRVLIASNLADLTFESAEIAFTSGGTGSVAHGLGVRPSIVEAWYRCKTAQGGYAVGAELPAGITAAPGVTNASGVQVYTDDTANIKYVQAAFGAQLQRVLSTAGVDMGMTSASWALFFRATV